MRKIISITALFLLFTISVSAQNYRFVHKKIETNSKKSNYQSVITYPQIENPANESQKGFNTFIKAKLDAQADSFKVWMKGWKTPKEMKGTGSYYDIGDSVLYSDGKVISVHFYGDSYFSGAAHPNNWSFAINYDMQNNREMQLSDIFTGDYVRLISDYCIDNITLQKKENYNPDLTAPDDFTLHGAGAREENFKEFNPTKDGFLITFPTYQVGAYVEGPMDVLMPYSALKDVIKGDGLLSKFIN